MRFGVVRLRKALGLSTIVPLGERSRIIVTPRVRTSMRAALGNPPDWPEMLVWQRHLSVGHLFVDVGAHIGFYTIIALDRGATVVAIEPTDTVEELKANLELNKYHAEILQCAVADTPGQVWMHGPDQARQHLTLNSGDKVGNAVNASTLDEIVSDREVSGIKIDVEGAERLVLGGAVQLLASRRIRLMQLEWNDTCLALLGETREPLAKILDQYGYRLMRPDSEGNLQPATGIGFGPDMFALRR